MRRETRRKARTRVPMAAMRYRPAWASPEMVVASLKGGRRRMRETPRFTQVGLRAPRPRMSPTAAAVRAAACKASTAVEEWAALEFAMERRL
jgi:hypothetical protein